MKQKNKKTLATLVTAVVVLIGGYIYQNNGVALVDTSHSTKIQSNSKEYSQKTIRSQSGAEKVNAQSNKNQSGEEDNAHSAKNQSGEEKENVYSAKNQSSSKKDNALSVKNHSGTGKDNSQSVKNHIDANKDSSQKTKSRSGSAENTEQLEKLTFPESILKIEKEGIVPFGYINAIVEKVVDGDTFHIKYKNKKYKVRMLDIDTPESVKSGVDVQPYAIEASDFTKATLKDKNVKLIFEKDTTDTYGRLLAHVILEDGTYYNAIMVLKGYAVSVFYNPNTLFKEYFTELQNKAIEDKFGFWKLPDSERPFIKNSKGIYMPAYKLKADAA